MKKYKIYRIIFTAVFIFAFTVGMYHGHSSSSKAQEDKYLTKVKWMSEGRAKMISYFSSPVGEQAQVGMSDDHQTQLLSIKVENQNQQQASLMISYCEKIHLQSSEEKKCKSAYIESVNVVFNQVNTFTHPSGTFTVYIKKSQKETQSLLNRLASI